MLYDEHYSKSFPNFSVYNTTLKIFLAIKSSEIMPFLFCKNLKNKIKRGKDIKKLTRDPIVPSCPFCPFAPRNP